MMRLKIWYSTQSNGTREGFNYGEEIRISILILRERPLIFHVEDLYRIW